MSANPHTALPLQGQRIYPQAGGVAGAYAADLLRGLGADCAPCVAGDGVDAAIDWAQSGLMALCGESQGLPRQGPAAIPSCARGVLQAIRALAPVVPATLDGAKLLSERAAILGLERSGAISPNQGCHLLQTRDGCLALNLVREDDWALLPAWLEQTDVDNWDKVEQGVRQRPLQLLLERGRLMGLALAATESSQVGEHWYRVHALGTQLQSPSPTATPLVVDLSSLWAGPLCSHLLQLAGARVIKVESSTRLDGARRGSPPFYDLLNSGKQSVALDLSTSSGRDQLQRLLCRADIVVEGSRPRALRQMGIDAEQLVCSVPGLTWVGISGYGRTEPEANWVAFGDDAAVSAGVAEACGDPPMFCGDALADPLTGLHAALAALAFWRGGGGKLLDLSLCGVTAHCLNYGPPVPRPVVSACEGRWQMEINSRVVAVAMPEPRFSARQSAAAGRDTRVILEEFAISC